MEHVRGFGSKKYLVNMKSGKKKMMCSVTKHVQAYLGDTVGSVPDHCSKAIIVLKQATSLLKKKKKKNH